MKKYINVFLIILCSFLFSGCGSSENSPVDNGNVAITEDADEDATLEAESAAAPSEAASLKDIWYETRYYPIYPGNDEWGKHNMDEVFDINNPPSDLLDSMPSDELADLLFASPYLEQMLTYYGEDGHIDYSMMFGFLELHSDIFSELLRRENGITEILKWYKNSGVDLQLFESESYNSSDEEWRRFLAEVFGSQFIRSYSGLFTKEETELAKQIIAVKNDIYLEAPNADGEYFNTSDIDHSDGYVVEYSGSFTATVEELIPDYCALPGNTIAVVHFFQDMPFLLRFDEDMSDKLIIGETYVFEFQPFEVEIPDEKNIPSISAHMYSIVITGYRVAEEGETGLNEISPTTEVKAL